MTLVPKITGINSVIYVNRIHNLRNYSAVNTASIYPRLIVPRMGQALVEAVLRRGYPEAVARTTARRRTAWAHQYVDAIKSPKMQFMDSGLLASILNLNTNAVQRNRSRFGHVLETFVYSEQLKMGVVLHDGTEPMPMGKGLWAAPLSSLWGI